MTVYANGLEVSAKAQGDKIIAAFPDTCFTPPENPATPPGVPVPYPTFGFDSDMDKGTSTVKIGGKTVGQKNISYYSNTTGTESGCATKKGLVTSTNRGKAYAGAWSGDVKAQGEPVPRMSDRATVNHASPVPNDGNGLIIGKVTPPDDCASVLVKFGLQVHTHGNKKRACNYKNTKRQSDHIPQATCFTMGSRKNGRTFAGGKYNVDAAPCVCLEDGMDRATEHGRKTEYQIWQTTVWKQRNAKTGWTPTFKDALQGDLNAIRYAKGLNPHTAKNPHPALLCLEMEILKYFRSLGIDEDTPVSIPDQGNTPETFASIVPKLRTGFLG